MILFINVQILYIRHVLYKFCTENHDSCTHFTISMVKLKQFFEISTYLYIFVQFLNS